MTAPSPLEAERRQRLNAALLAARRALIEAFVELAAGPPGDAADVRKLRGMLPVLAQVAKPEPVAVEGK